MTSDFPRSPKFLKGALVSFPSHFLGPVPNVIVFQYNPDKLSRTLAHRPQAGSQDRGRGPAGRAAGTGSAGGDDPPKSTKRDEDARLKCTNPTVLADDVQSQV